jgi:hypothetical protein
MSDRRIIGIVLVHNEDLHVAYAISNMRDFCDHILLVDHASTDATAEILQNFAGDDSELEYHRISHPRHSHELLQRYVNTDSWIFGVDGDEIYDPAGLRQMREQILSGSYQQWWMILGNVLNCDHLDTRARAASGFLAPPCRSITKLYNFSLITAWSGKTPERLHGGRLNFHPGNDASARHNLHEELPWEKSPLRCLHTCFLPRSSLDPAVSGVRENIIETFHPKLHRRLHQWWQRLRGASPESHWKKSRYMRGERVTKDVSAFFST